MQCHFLCDVFFRSNVIHQKHSTTSSRLMHSTVKITDSSASQMESSSNEGTIAKTGYPHYQPEWDNHPVCRLCHSRQAKGVKYCNRDDPCEVCASWSDDTWEKSDDSLKRKLAKDKKKDRSRSTSDSSKNVSVSQSHKVITSPQTKPPDVGLTPSLIPLLGLNRPFRHHPSYLCLLYRSHPISSDRD